MKLKIVINVTQKITPEFSSFIKLEDGWEFNIKIR